MVSNNRERLNVPRSIPNQRPYIRTVLHLRRACNPNRGSPSESMSLSFSVSVSGTAAVITMSQLEAVRQRTGQSIDLLRSSTEANRSASYRLQRRPRALRANFIAQRPTTRTNLVVPVRETLIIGRTSVRPALHERKTNCRVAASSHRSNAPIKPKSQSILSKIVALTPLKLTSDISRKLERFPPKGYPLKVIALALSEKEDCGWNTSSEDRTELSQRCPSNFRIGLVAAPGAAGSMRVERQPLQLVGGV
jgi:hypothetical protein